MAAMFGSNRSNTWGNPLLNRQPAAATPAAQLQGFDPMQSFMGLLPGLLQQPGLFARPEASQFLAQLFGGQQPGAPAAPAQGAPGQVMEIGNAWNELGGTFTGGPGKYLDPTITQVPNQPNQWLTSLTGEPGSGPVSAPSPQRPQGGLMSMIQQMMARVGQGTTSTSPGARGPAPSPFTGLRRFAGPFGNGGGGISPGLDGFATQAY